MESKKTGLTEKDLKYIVDIFQEDQSIENVILFGSRAMGNYKKGSDIDLAVKSPDFNIDSVITRIKERLENDSPLPYFFDIIHYESIDSEELKKHIDDVGVELFS